MLRKWQIKFQGRQKEIIGISKTLPLKKQVKQKIMLLRKQDKLGIWQVELNKNPRDFTTKQRIMPRGQLMRYQIQDKAQKDQPKMQFLILHQMLQKC